MTSTSPILLILGSGANVGQSVARAFAAQGYKVALTSRKASSDDDTTEQVSIAGDLSKPETVAGIFSKVKELLGIPSVVVYNGKTDVYDQAPPWGHADLATAAAVTPSEAKDPLSLPLTDFIRDLNVNTTSAFVAAQQAALGFAELPDSASKTFIYTGNILNEKTVLAPFMNLGVGKSATSHMIHCAATVYAERGFKYA